MGRLPAKTTYEDLRNARIQQNQARLDSLQLHKTLSELQSLSSSAKPSKTHVRKCCKKVYDLTSLRRSDRLKGATGTRIEEKTPSHTSFRLKRSSKRLTVTKYEESEDKRVEVNGLKKQLARRCDSKGRGSVYNSHFGICCHFCSNFIFHPCVFIKCRQKKLCGEEDCKRCGTFDMDQPCIGKTDCSVCHSSNGVLCRACLKVRYGEEMDEVRENKEWMCPHCIEQKGLRPYWICNSSFCMKKRKMAPTGIAIYRCQELGYKSVAHLLMDELQQKDQLRK